jgi:hemolysin activation/secretion protein
VPALPLHEERLVLGFTRSAPVMLGGFETRFAGQLRGGLTQPLDDRTDGDGSFARAMLTAHGERKLGDGRLVLEGTVAGVTAQPGAPPQELVYLGGPVSGPGYDYHQFAGRVGASARVEWRSSVPFFGLSLGPYGKAPARATLAPFATMIYSGNEASFAPDRAGWYPAVGVGALLFFDLLRLDVARGLHHGRWTFSLDVTRDLWPIL